MLIIIIITIIMLIIILQLLLSLFLFKLKLYVRYGRPGGYPEISLLQKKIKNGRPVTSIVDVSITQLPELTCICVTPQ